MTTVAAALAAMDTAGQEARDVLAMPQTVRGLPTWRWARDRLRLIQRDRETLQRHSRNTGEADECGLCISYVDLVGHDYGNEDWPCPDARAVINHWTENA